MCLIFFRSKNSGRTSMLVSDVTFSEIDASFVKLFEPKFFVTM